VAAARAGLVTEVERLRAEHPFLAVLRGHPVDEARRPRLSASRETELDGGRHPTTMPVPAQCPLARQPWPAWPAVRGNSSVRGHLRPPRPPGWLIET
jgi:hypothetical protein